MLLAQTSILVNSSRPIDAAAVSLEQKQRHPTPRDPSGCSRGHKISPCGLLEHESIQRMTDDDVDAVAPTAADELASLVRIPQRASLDHPGEIPEGAIRCPVTAFINGAVRQCVLPANHVGGHVFN
jgi:hypothetical protein